MQGIHSFVERNEKRLFLFKSCLRNRTHPLEPQGFEGCFPCFGRGGFPCFFPYWNLQAGNRPNLLFHPVSAGLFHLGGDMSVNVQRKGGGSVSQVFLHRLNVIPGLNCHNRICMPLWHNKDKSENPCVATGWRFVLILFPPKTALKRGLREGVKNQGCT